MSAIDDSVERNAMAQMLENQQNWLDDNSWNPPAGTDRGRPGFFEPIIDRCTPEEAAERARRADEMFDGVSPILIPVSRRIRPELVAANIVGVQPMTAPTGHTWNATFNYDGWDDTFASFQGRCDCSIMYDGDMIRCGKYENSMMCCEMNCVAYQNRENNNE